MSPVYCLPSRPRPGIPNQRSSISQPKLMRVVNNPFKKLHYIPVQTKQATSMRAKIFKNSQEFVRYAERITGRPFKTTPSTDGTTAHKYLSGGRHWINLVPDSDLLAVK